MLLGSESSVLVLHLSPSPVPSIQMYMACTLSPCGSSIYWRLTSLLNWELADVAMLITIRHLNKRGQMVTHMLVRLDASHMLCAPVKAGRRSSPVHAAPRVMINPHHPPHPQGGFSPKADPHNLRLSSTLLARTR